jgi:hypothetical protein
VPQQDVHHELQLIGSQLVQPPCLAGSLFTPAGEGEPLFLAIYMPAVAKLVLLMFIVSAASASSLFTVRDRYGNMYLLASGAGCAGVAWRLWLCDPSWVGIANRD